MECIDALAARLAATQHGLVSYDQLRKAGATRQQIRTRVEQGRWTTVDGTIIRIAGLPESWESKVMAAVLAGGRRAVASHRCAARLWGLEGIYADTPEITVPRGRRFERSAIICHQSTDLDRTTPTAIRGIPVTLVARTLLDLGAVVHLNKVRVAVDDARRRRLTKWTVLRETLEVHARRGRDGAAALRTIVEDHFGEVTKTDSGFERLVLVALREGGFPEPVLQHEVIVAGLRYRIDLAYPDVLLAIELDGRRHLAEDVWQADHQRQNDLVNAGWTVLRFTWKDFTERWEQMDTAIRTALRKLRAKWL